MPQRPFPNLAPFSCVPARAFPLVPARAFAPVPARAFPPAAQARALALAAFAAFGSPAAAEEADVGGDAAIEEIIVTATLRDTDARSVPASVTVLDSEAIARREATHLDELLGAIPNLNFAKGASRARFLQLRGVGERGQFEEPLNPSVGLIVDGVDLSGIGTVVGLFDVDQVEVLRGPQGTLYGANALAGLVNVVTRAPTDTPAGHVTLEVGDYGGQGAGIAVSGPLSERARGRLAAHLERSDGFIENDHLGRDDTDNVDETAVRARLAFDLSATTELNLALGVLEADNGYDAFSLDNARTTLADQPGHDRQKTTYGTASVDWQGGGVSAQGHVAVARSDIAYGYDVDWVYEGFHPWGYSYTDDYLRDRATRTAEVRLRSEPQGRLFADSTDWTAGWYFLDQDVDLTRKYTGLDADFASAFGMRRHALYGQMETDFNARTSLTVGARLERHSATYRDSNGIAFAPQDTMLGGRVALRRELSSRTHVYGAAARGYKAGGFNADGTLAADLRVYGPETLWNYEAGLASALGDGALALRLAVFAMRRDDVQIESSLSRRNADGSTEFIQYVGNAAQGANSGAELELTYGGEGNAVLFARLGLLRTEYQDFVTGDGESFDGREQAHAPGYQANIGGEWAFPTRRGAFFARLEADARDAFYFSDNHNLKSAPYQLVHAGAGYRGGGWNVRVWGKNLTDENYFVRGFFFGNDPRDGYAARGFTQLGAPRRFGVSASKAW